MLALRLHTTMLLVSMIAVLCGCGQDRGLERVVVSGSVNHNGKPLPSGSIQFVPNAASPVPTAGAQIRDGQYKTTSHGGVPVGTHRIHIEAYRTRPNPATTNTSGPPGMEGADQQYLPSKYNANSQLEITIEPGSPPITKNFALTD